MPKKAISAEKKAKIIDRVKKEGASAAQIAEQEGIHVNTIYKWLEKDSNKASVSWLEHKRIVKENDDLKKIIGHLTLDISKQKKI